MLIDGAIYLAVHPVVEGVYRIVVRIKNVTPLTDVESTKREDALMRSLVSAHLLLGVREGEFVSLLDPPESLREVAGQCRNVGAFPVLVGEEGKRDTMLSSPIILYDYPQIAPESAGDLFDGTEIDEILSLRIMTMTEDEKLEMRQSDERARQMLERTETLPVEQLMKLHGVLRGLRPIEEEIPMNEWEWQLLEDKTPVEHLEIAGVQVKAGDRVRLRPRKGGDVLDIALAGQTASVEALEQDYEGKFHVCVVLDNDPGRDLGLLRQPGHRFFFDPDEVEPLRRPEHRGGPGNTKAQHPDRRYWQHLSWGRRLRCGSCSAAGGAQAAGCECEWQTSAFEASILPTPCRTDTRPPSWWMRFPMGRSRVRYPSLILT